MNDEVHAWLKMMEDHTRMQRINRIGRRTIVAMCMIVCGTLLYLMFR